MDFEWVVVDDGSTDNTPDYLTRCMGDDNHNFSIQYIQQTNGGKQRAHNAGVQACRTELFVCVDSDDWLNADAVERILSRWKTNTFDPSVGGIVAPSFPRGESDEEGRNLILEEGTLTTLTGLYAKGYRGETTLIYRTEILKNYPFPEIDGEKFISEVYVYNQIDEKYQLSFMQKGLVQYEYQPDGYTANIYRLMFDNPKGYVLLHNQMTKLSPTLKKKIKSAAQYLIFSKIAKQKNAIIHCSSPILALCSIPWAIMYYHSHLIKQR